MAIQNALASIAVRDVGKARIWYEMILGPGSRPMPEVVEWTMARGGGLQVYQLPERAGQCSCTIIVTQIEHEIQRLVDLNIDTSQQSSTAQVKTVMVKDPDGNHIAFAEPFDADLAS